MTADVPGTPNAPVTNDASATDGVHVTGDLLVSADLAVIGAGPGGLAAALTAADYGVSVALADAGADAGGQFYRQPAARLHARRARALHHDWATWERLRAQLDAHIAAGRIRHLARHHVWNVERHPSTDSHDTPSTKPHRMPSAEGRHLRSAEGGFVIHALTGDGQDEPRTIVADAVLLATGGYETVLAFPGWTLPGVSTAGGAQAMLKGNLVLPGGTVVVAGTGPLLLPVAAGLAAAGARVAALVESADPRAFVRQGLTLAAHPGKLAEGAEYAARLARYRVPLRWRHTVIAAHGTDRVEAVTIARLDADGRVQPGTEQRIRCDALAVSHGLQPHTDLAQTLGASIGADGVAVDDEQRTDVPGLWTAGEATGIGGATLALAEGEIAGRSVAGWLRGTASAQPSDPVEGKPDSPVLDGLNHWKASDWKASDIDPGASRSQAAITRHRMRRFVAAIDSVYAPPAHWTEAVTDDTVVCRCEEVTAGAIREATELGATDARTVKLLTRAGMGWCQGRICGSSVAGLLSGRGDGRAGSGGGAVARALTWPVPLGVLAHEAPAREEPASESEQTLGNAKDPESAGARADTARLETARLETEEMRQP
jgi:thioredoxin reductase